MMNKLSINEKVLTKPHYFGNIVVDIKAGEVNDVAVTQSEKPPRE
jgi:hypothetical protein